MIDYNEAESLWKTFRRKNLRTINCINKDVKYTINHFNGGADLIDKLRISVMAIDYNNSKIEYLNQTAIKKLQFHSNKSKQLTDITRFIQRIHKSDVNRWFELMSKSINTIHQHLTNKKETIEFKFYYRFKDNGGNYMWLLQINKLFYELDRWNEVIVLIICGEEDFNPTLDSIIHLNSHFFSVQTERNTEHAKKLGNRTMSVAILSYKGKSIKEISEKLQISYAGVRYHRNKIVNYFGVSTLNKAFPILFHHKN